jgi:NTP pyrophosphatase (non-canonical NTP hydrolase)
MVEIKVMDLGTLHNSRRYTPESLQIAIAAWNDRQPHQRCGENFLAGYSGITPERAQTVDIANVVITDVKLKFDNGAATATGVVTGIGEKLLAGTDLAGKFAIRGLGKIVGQDTPPELLRVVSIDYVDTSIPGCRIPIRDHEQVPKGATCFNGFQPLFMNPNLSMAEAVEELTALAMQDPSATPTSADFMHTLQEARMGEAPATGGCVQYTLAECIELFKEWGHARDITKNGKVRSQSTKFYEESGEIAGGICKSNVTKVTDGVGDVLCTLSTMFNVKGLDFQKYIGPVLIVDEEYVLTNDPHEAIGIYMEAISRVLTTINTQATRLAGRLIREDLEIALYALHDIAAYYQLTLAECASEAWHAIKDRVGQMDKHGMFVKESDL